MDRPLASSSSTGSAAAQWTLRLLGPFALIAPGSGERAPLPGKRERVLLAYLALSPNFRAPRRKLTSLLWGEGSDETTLENLRVCIWRLRKTLRDTQHRIIASEGEDIVLDISAVAVDVLAFRRLAAASGTAELEAAANLYAGEFLEAVNLDGEEFESWRRTEGTRCRDQILDVLARLMAQLAESGESDRAIEMGLRILQLEPLHEPAVCRLMRLYADSGRRAPAVELYRTLADALKTELDAQPQPETRAVFAQISRGDEAPPAFSAAPGASIRAIAPRPAVRSAAARELPLAQSRVVADATPPGTTVRRTYAVIVAGAVAAVMLVAAAYQFASATFLQQRQPITQTAAASTVPNAISIAVLPFANFSGDPNQEFFSDGMTEEVIAALAKIPDLRVVARTSAFQFKNQARDIQSIGRQLHATHLIEGSVRKAGDRVRIAVQLINAGDGKHVWAEEYDRRLTDIFAIQEEIARTIAASLHKPLGLKAGENLVNNRPTDPAIYDDFLRAKARWWAGDTTQVIRILETVVARAPDYAPAWSLLANAYTNSPFAPPNQAVYSNFELSSDGLEQFRAVMGGAIKKADTAAHRALELDVSDANAWLALAKNQMDQGNYARAEELNARALSLDPDNALVLINRNQLMHDMGYLKQALSLSQRATLLEPFAKTYSWRVPVDLWLNGRTDEAIKSLEPLLAQQNRPAALFLARFYAEQGRYGEAADLLLTTQQTFGRSTVETAARLLRNGRAKPSPESLPKLGQLYWVYFFVGAPEYVLDWNEQVQKLGYWAAVYPFWAKEYASIRKTERFKNYVRSLGFVDYWRQHGWPDLCYPVGTDDFVCD